MAADIPSVTLSPWATRLSRVMEYLYGHNILKASEFLGGRRDALKMFNQFIYHNMQCKHITQKYVSKCQK